MPAASLVFGVVTDDWEAVVLPLLAPIVLEVWLLALVPVPLACPLLGLVVPEAAELGAVEALLEDVCDALELMSELEFGAAVELEAVLGAELDELV
jgi:hypothetical protein